MGAGNHYTLKEDRSILAIQVDTSIDMDDEDDQELASSYAAELAEEEKLMLIDHLLQLPICQKFGLGREADTVYCGDFYLIRLMPNYHGDAIVIDLEYRDVEPSLAGLQQHNYAATYARLARHVNKYTPVFVGHGYTSTEYRIGELH